MEAAALHSRYVNVSFFSSSPFFSWSLYEEPVFQYELFGILHYVTLLLLWRALELKSSSERKHTFPHTHETHSKETHPQTQAHTRIIT